MGFDDHYNVKSYNKSQIWDRNNCTIADEVTNAYGNVRFPGKNEDISKYVRVYFKTPMEKMMQLLFDQQFWELKSPRLLISVTGGAKISTISSHLLRDTLCKGLVKAASTTSKLNLLILILDQYFTK